MNLFGRTVKGLYHKEVEMHHKRKRMIEEFGRALGYAVAPEKPCKVHCYRFKSYCGAHVCVVCDDHKGLARCYCGWSRTNPGKGRQELEEMGEVIDAD